MTIRWISRTSLAVQVCFLLVAAPRPSAAAQAADGKACLLLLSHGSPSGRWSAPVEALLERVRGRNRAAGTFLAVENAYLEFARPDARDGVEKLEAAGCGRIIVTPLFIAPSSHSHFDVPAVLGLYTSPEIREVLAAEGGRTASPEVPVTLTQTMDQGGLLERYAAEEVKALSRTPAEEALVVLAHGDEGHYGLVEDEVRRVTAYAAGRAGIDYADRAYCEMGQSFWETCAPAITRAAKAKKRVLVVGLYLSSSADSIRLRARERAPEGALKAFDGGLAASEVVYSSSGVITRPYLADWAFGSAASGLAAGH